MRILRSLLLSVFLLGIGTHLYTTRKITPPAHSGVWVSTYGSILLRVFSGYRRTLHTHSLTPQTESLVFPEKVNNKYWLDITRPAARAYILDIFREFRRAYPDLPVHLDDHWAVPARFGPHAEAVTSLTHEVAAVTGPVSLSAHPLAYARAKYSMDWVRWHDEGLLEEFILQNYVPANFEAHLETLRAQTAAWSIPVKVGVYGGPGLTARDLQAEIGELRAEDIPVVLFPWKAFYF